MLTPDRVVATLAALIPFVYFFPAVFGDVVLAPDDGLLFNVPLRTTAAQLLRAGSIPLWNPFIFSGMPLHASVQGGLLFPLNWWFLIFNPATAANLMVLTTYSVAGVGAYLYARKTGASISGAFATSFMWQLSGCLVGQISHINIAQTAAMLPWVLWSIEKFSADGKRRWAIVISIMVSLQVFVGHPQTLVYSLLLISVYSISMALAQPQRRLRYFSSLAFVIGGLLLAAVQILPTFELLRNSIRSDTSYQFFTSFSLPGRFIASLVAPYLLGGGDGRLFRAPYVGPPYYAEFIPYVGVGALILGICALTVRRDLLARFWIAVAVVGFALALGDNLPFGLYRIVYHLPLLNLFRVPARHLMEVDFALAVLVGRGLTALGSVEITGRKRTMILLTCLGAIVVTCLVVTVGRPPDFRLGRDAAVSILRAPELFLPIIVALVSAAAVWFYVSRRKPWSIALLLFVLLFDLALWGQFSGWIGSPRRSNEMWSTPASVQALRALDGGGNYRILTAPHSFSPDVAPVPPSVSHSPEWSLWTQADLYMAHGIRNAGGYDGFGLQRYGRLAGDMKVWGELTDPNATLRGPSREIDILNVRYVVAMRRDGDEPRAEHSRPPEKGTQQLGPAMFAPTDLGLANLKSGSLAQFETTPVEVDRIALVTNLSWSQNLPDGTVVARVRLTDVEGQTFELPLRVGVDTAEWAHDRRDINAVIRHKRATVATSYPVQDSQQSYEAHTYVTTLALPKRVTVSSVQVATESIPDVPQLLLSVFRISLAKGADFYALSTYSKSDAKEASTQAPPQTRWKLVSQTKEVDIFENSRVLSRAWLATELVTLDEEATLQTIRTGRLPDGTTWNPERTALVERGAEIALAPQGGQSIANIVQSEPNRIEIDTLATGPSILVLSENHYPGWRAYVDGQNIDVWRVNYNLRGIPLTPGQHRVSFVYRPKSVLIGLLTSLGTAVLLGLWSAGVIKVGRTISS